MRISYGRAIYVGQTPKGILDSIDRHINTVATGDDNVVVSREELISFLDEYKEDCDMRSELVTPEIEKMGHFLIESYERMEGEFGDIFFST